MTDERQALRRPCPRCGITPATTASTTEHVCAGASVTFALPEQVRQETLKGVIDRLMEVRDEHRTPPSRQTHASRSAAATWERAIEAVRALRGESHD